MADRYWIQHHQPPWYQRPAPMEYGLELNDGTWLTISKHRHEEGGWWWDVVWAMTGLRGQGTSLVLRLFTTRRIMAAKALGMIWATDKGIFSRYD